MAVLARERDEGPGTFIGTDAKEIRGKCLVPGRKAIGYQQAMISSRAGHHGVKAA